MLVVLLIHLLTSAAGAQTTASGTSTKTPTVVDVLDATVPLKDVIRIPLTEMPHRRVKVAGTVTGHEGRRSLYITDGEHHLEVRPVEATSVVPGDVIEVVGFVAGTSTTRLVDATVRRVGSTQPPEPIRLNAARLLAGNYRSALVTVEGTLVRHVVDANNQELVLRSDGITFEASLSIEDGASLAALVPGSVLEVTGITWLRGNGEQLPASFDLLLRSVNDVHVLARPSPWTLRRALYATGLILIGFLTSAGWVVALRRRIPAIERARLESDERYRQIFEQAPAGHFVSRADGTLLACNEAFARMLGFASAASAAAANCQSLYADAADRQHGIELLRQGGLLENREVTLRTPDGRLVPALETAVARFGPDGEIGEIQGFLIDLTKQKQAEAALKERDAQLQESQKMEAIGRLAGGVAHDFNNLLTVVAGNVDFAIQAARSNSSVPTEYLLEIQEAARSATGLTRQLLAFSSRQLIEPTLLDVNAVVSGFEKMLRRLIGEDVQLTLRTYPEPLRRE